MFLLNQSFLAASPDYVWSESFVLRALKFKEGMLLRHLAARLLNKVNSVVYIIKTNGASAIIEAVHPNFVWNYTCIFHIISKICCWSFLHHHKEKSFFAKVSNLSEEPFLAWNDCLDHVLTLAWTHIHRGESIYIYKHIYLFVGEEFWHLLLLPCPFSLTPTLLIPSSLIPKTPSCTTLTVCESSILHMFIRLIA